MAKNFSLIGAGNLGSHLLHALVGRGYRLGYLYNRSKFGLFSEFLTDDLGQLVARADFVVIATQESRIPEVVELLSREDGVAGKVVFHMANALTSDILALLREKGAIVASFSPLQTFPAFLAQAPEEVFAGTYFLAEGDGPAVLLARQIALDLQAEVILVEKEKKTYYHMAAVAACNFLVAIMKLAERQLQKSQQPSQTADIAILLPLVYRTLENIRVHGVEASLTGPFKRKETAIIQKHLELLEGEDAVLYRALTHYLGV